MHLTELTRTTGLLLMTIIGTCSLGDCLAIRDLRLLEGNHHLVVVLQTPLECTQVELTLTADDSLLQFFALLNEPCRIFLMHTCEQCAQFLGFLLVVRTDSAAVLRIGIADGFVLQFAILGVEGVTGASIFQLNRGSDVACANLIYRHADAAVHSVELRDTLLGAAVHVHKVVGSVYGALHNLEVVDITDMRLNRGLEDEHRNGSFVVGSDLHTLGAQRLGCIGYCGSHLTEELHESAYAHVACT